MNVNVEFVGRRYQGKQAQKAVFQAWEDFVVHGECRSPAVRPMIMQSWQRCVENGTAASSDQLKLITKARRLEKLRDDNLEILTAMETIRCRLEDVFRETESIVLLADRNGVLIETFGSNKLLDLAKAELITPGYKWDEGGGGTNAVGTALELRRAVEIHAAEHFCEPIKQWSCSAAPVVDPLDGELLGVVDVTTLSETYSSQNIALAVTAAQQIEERIQSSDLAKRMELIHWYRDIRLPERDDGLVLLDRKGRVVLQNRYADRMLFGPKFARALTASLPRSDIRQETLHRAATHLLPEDIRIVSVRAFGKQSRWQGGLLVLSQGRSSNDTASVRNSAGPTIDGRKVLQAFAPIIGTSANIVAAKNRAERIAASSSPTLLLGETGSGKELFARAIHNASSVADGPFVAVNCGSLTRELAVSELFGYASGAFTGAKSSGRPGKFEDADGGTLFLDEIGELPPDIQVSLLRVLQDGVVVRVGNIKRTPS